MILASVLISSEEFQHQELPVKVRENLDSFKRENPGIEHQLFRDSETRKLIAKHFDKRVMSAYHSLKPYSYKCDLARLCIMYVYGGVYADISCYFVGKWPPFLVEQESSKPRLAVFRDVLSSTPWDTVNSVFASPPRHKAIAKAIELICANVKKHYYGPTNLCPTGPTLFGKAIGLTCGPEDLIVGDSAPVGPNDLPYLITEVSHGFVYKGRIIAVKRKRGGESQAELGILGGNSYADLWRARDVYQ